MSMAVACAGCGLRIVDRYLLRVHDQLWHEHCLRCSQCRICLDSTCFARQGQFYCRNDFYRLFGPKCSGCHGSLQPADFVRRIGNCSFHLDCCACTGCGRLLSTGEQLRWTEKGQLLCSRHWTQALRVEPQPMAPSSAHPFYPSPLVVSRTTSEASTHDLPSPFKPQHLTGLEPRADICSVEGGTTQPQQISTMPFQYTELQATVARSSPTPMWTSPLQGDPAPVLTEMEKEPRRGELQSPEEDLPLPYASSPDESDADEEEEEEPGRTTSSSSAPRQADTNGKKRKQAGREEKSKSQRKGTKSERGPRTTITPKQQDVLKKAFGSTPKPSKAVREQLSRETGLNNRVIQVWFQNRRSKERRNRQMAAERASAGLPPPGQVVESKSKSWSPRTTSLLVEDALASADEIRSQTQALKAAGQQPEAQTGSDSSGGLPHTQDSGSEQRSTDRRPSGQESQETAQSPPSWERQLADYSWAT